MGNTNQNHNFQSEQGPFEDRGRDVSPKKAYGAGSGTKGISCNDVTWNNYMKIANEENGASKLRTDA